MFAVRESHGPQAADGVSVAPGVAAPHGPRPRRARRSSNRVRSRQTESISGNDNDADPAGVEPHHAEITRPDQVQIYESVMRDGGGRPTTGLLAAVGYLKDNRLLPRGFQKTGADPWVAVVGEAAGDSDFSGSGDRVRYSIDVAGADGPFQIDVELRYQVIGFRWAENLRPYKAAETTRFVGYYDSMASASSEVLVKAGATAR